MLEISRLSLSLGQQTLLRIDQAMGRAEEALTFRRPPNPWFARLAFFEPISTLEDLQRVARDVAAKIARQSKDFSAKFPTISISKNT